MATTDGAASGLAGTDLTSSSARPTQQPSDPALVADRGVHLARDAWREQERGDLHLGESLDPGVRGGPGPAEVGGSLDAGHVAAGEHDS